ncbi:glycerophosphodiester phosphodiesterase [Streptomyces sp. NPDC054949]|uniref:glycerophosphodiester phosphodiesterase n=1 Tax=unclassified Streptomyces TaxID=2593676 RepID=UPI000AA1FD7D|nr:MULTISPECIES: glycerophosphodiester phosphodiesterase [unclassified Streptomyces]MCX5073087.1 glycerophosphodiester phosphodiesterase [Streptomyces sp. NBC_00424]MCX5155381.1 glycerophosphodiester phosphodiesterase [Streptomyces sp. NBC_00291]WUD43627.1 glycerophosphodiester phosphodiesterase [Streptomyces sp. NBC_00513]
MRTLTAVGHRGDPYRVRENTLDSIRSAFARGADAVEIDVRLTRDRVPVVLHDETLQRLWGHDVRLDAVTAPQLKELARGGIPTLREALEAAGAGRVMVDLPGADSDAVRTVVDQVRECGARERTYYCAGPESMLAVRAADPGAEIALTWTTLSPPRRVLIDAVAPAWLNYRFGLVDRELTDALHRDGLLVSAWTADTKRSMRALIAAGVDSITTNRVDALTAVRAERRR